MARLKPLSPAEAGLLEALSRYRLLTTQHAERLGIANITHARERLRALHTAGLAHCTQRGRLAGPNVYALSHKGAATLREWSEGRIDAHGRKEPMRATEHLNQRVAIVDAHIGLREWADTTGAVVNWVRVEFDTNPVAGAGRPVPATSVTHSGVRYDPDMVASVTTPDGFTWLFAIEVETGGVGERLGNFKALLEPRLIALRGRILENGLNWPQDGKHKRSRILFIFKTGEMLQRAMGIMERFDHDQLKGQLAYVLANSAEAHDSFGDGWQRVGGDAVKLAT